MAKYRKLSRTSDQRRALLKNQVTALLYNGKIVTTEAKAKEVQKIAENSKVAARSIRRDCIEKLKAMKKNSEITEDDLKDGEKEIQKITDNCIKDIEAVADAKEKEIMEI